MVLFIAKFNTDINNQQNFCFAKNNTICNSYRYDKSI